MASFTTQTATTGAVSVAAGVLLGMGNPLLDISAVVGEEVFAKYGVKNGDAILCEDKHKPVYSELVDNYEVEYIAGGATQNAIRVAQWMLQSEGATSFIGSVGKDAFADQLKAAALGSGVNAHYFVTEKVPTGTCAVLVKGGERSLIANLSAANEYLHSHTVAPEAEALIAKAQFFYIASFFLTVPEGPQSAVLVAKHAAENNKTFMINLSAPFLIDFFASQMNELLPYTDFIFGNEIEAATFGKKQGWECDLEEVALRLSAMPKASGARCRTVVFTQGAAPTIVASNGVVTLYPVKPLAKEALVDTNGAGDAFVGGFISRLVAGADTAACVTAGTYAARVVIQRSGCTYPTQPDI